ncbi:ABC transporter ATP-binding protein [Aliiruegeria lutimaris]|uniref:Peptide/nickel transport system ATP-binding protein n=1 Tax=Aliiruegeria lutimaris TaxID=571298 RepID=A0A1G9D8S7_9RHOB|nr:ABC transporter ATP-binding protein [Aliiruegeria lutimaris]SDK60135.1 peptide/nickel transport system ATP-binding protein [Aliiruegeria lutimaris]
MSRMETILSLKNLQKTFTARRKGKTYKIHAVNDISLDVRRGETLGIVGETGCGKTTVGRTIIRLTTADSGVAELNGNDIFTSDRQQMRKLRLKVRMVFQDPYASLNPRRTIGDSVGETGDIHGVFDSRRDREERIARTLEQVGLDASFANRFPHQLSGGQRQRVGIARALLPTPDLIIADEPVSALDVSIQAQVLNLLADLKDEMGLTMVFISHDLGVVAQISDRVAVMYMGNMVELADGPGLFANPQHPYTQLLIASVPLINPNKRVSGGIEKGEPPSRFADVSGCAFHDRCPLATDLCRTTRPELRKNGIGRKVACHHA